MAPRRKAASVTDAEFDDDDQSTFLDTGSSYPYFHTADPALAAAYAYGDPSGGSHYPDPIALYGGSVAPHSRSQSPDQIQYDDEDDEGDEEEDVEDDDDEEAFDRDLAISQAVAEAKLPRIDPDYDSAAEEDLLEAVSDDDFEGSDDDGAARGKRGRGRGRGGRSRGQRASRAVQPPRASRGRGRGRGRGQGRGRGSGDGVGRRGLVGKKHGPRAMAEPTAEFKNFNSLMNAAYIAEDFDEALKQGLQAVRVNPEMFHVHATIAEILLRKGRKDDALGALYVGVHATRDEGSWWYVIEKLIELGGGTKDTMQRLQDCYSSLLDMDPENYKARFGRMKNYMASGQRNRARNECLNLINRNPYDTEALQVLAEICFAVEEPTIAAPAFKKYFEHIVDQGPPEDSEVAWKLLDLYMDLLVHSSKWEEALQKLRSLARWILGRAEETFWDEYEDDREWDFDDEPRRSAVEEYNPEKYSLQAYGEGLPIELRQKIGLVRLGMGLPYHAEALDHFEYLEPEDDSADAYVYEYPDLFREIGDALREEQLHQDALRFYEPIQRQQEGVDSRFYFDIAICYQALGRTEDVNTTMEALRLFKRGARDANFYVGLAKLYQSQGKEAEMNSIVRQLKRMGKSDVVIAAGLPCPRDTTRPPGREQTAIDDGEESLDDRASGMYRSFRARSTRARRDKKLEQAKFRETIIQNLHNQARALEDEVASYDANAVLDWMNIAEQLIDEFKTEKIFFPRERASKFTGYERWQRTVTVPAGDPNFEDDADDDKEVPKHYCGIHFDEWLDVMLQLALLQAREGKAEPCWEITKTIAAANVFSHEPERMQKAHNVSLTCALLLEDEKQLIEETRWFIKYHPFIADSYRLYSAMNRFCRGPTTYYNSGPEQKFVLRAVKAMDFSLLPPEHRAKFGFTDGDREKWTEPAPDTGNPHQLTEHDPTLLTLYGHMMFVAATYSSALTYYFRAYVLRPGDPILNLCIGIAYIQMGYKRQADNRQYQIQQGLSFMNQYYDLRVKDDIAIKMQEAEFNMGLVWHTLGLQHLALPAYERCIALSGRVQKERVQASVNEKDKFVEDLAAEAAFAVQGILAMGGDFEGARRITEQHLVL